VAGSSISLAPPTESRFDWELGVDLAIRTLKERPEIAGVFGLGSENGPSFGVASTTLGREGELKIVAVDLVTATRLMLREGVIHAAIAQREHEMGGRAVRVLHDMRTRGIPEVLAELPASRFLDTGIDLVTLERTPWSTALADYLSQDAGRKLATRRPGARAARDIEILVVGMAEPRAGPAEESARFGAASLIGRVIESGRSVVIDASSSEHDGWADVVAARRGGVRIAVAVPLVGRRGVLGALVLGSERAGACSTEDLAFLERIAATVAVVIENAQLLQGLAERSRDLERANEEQEALLRTVAELSSPVVPIAPGVLVMPLVGSLDRERSGRFMEAMLHEIAERRARVVLLDGTGLSVMDAASASLFLQAARAAGLLGAEVVLVGISPGAARLLVEQGFDLGGVVTRSTLELGFAYALAKTGGRIAYGRAAALGPSA
jgi:anti-anti-sigma factor